MYIFDSKRKLCKNKVFNINCGDNIIKSISTVKYFGLVLDNTRSSENCANDIIKKANSLDLNFYTVTEVY